ncbi:LysM peptidoglycan-binding domain-containing protein [Tabrizicola sp. J26]|uniref:LysM peptidoglycan-binding domain-containing protein n=1 Tax=Alitabrizicola rongguiensis TaxID=2909234 RepID=UPI001F1F25B5|nr:LysM peptidoglycan-binding domain-containing protein [Tabrizicola rongguiensis]MCF1709629.1 LysM peptidoglycan-binding domain-containing protein [Tabrizicola rongguiensis]
MSGWKELGAGAKTLAIAGGAAVVVGVGALIWKGQAPAPQPAETAAPAPEPEKATAAEPPAETAPAAEPAATESAPATEPATEQATTAEASAAEPPAFDVVRVSPEGDALVAGRALAEAEVSVMVDGVATASAVADQQGKFVAMFTLPPSEAPRVVKLSMKPETGAAIASVDEVVLAPTPATATAEPAGTETAQASEAVAETAQSETAQTETAQTEAAATAPEGTEVAAAETTEAMGADTSEAVQPAATGTGAPAATTAAGATEDDSEPETEPTTATAVLVTDEGAKVVQGATALPDNVTIGAISYSTTGAVQLSGHGKAGSPLRLYLDNTPVLETSVGTDGSWSGTLGEVAPGIYTLRADQLDAAGDVTSRYETPFQREAPDALAALRSKTGKPVNITVQPGFTLWEIAKENYGDGVMYVRVFEANKAQIKDPDLIYPGQVFSVPRKD